MSRHFAVFGTPIAHSLSPRIHAAFARQTGIALDYVAIEAGHDDFAMHLAAFADNGGHGANVTLPLKESAFALCSNTSERALRAGAVNTLLRDGDGWRGDNTDGAGLLRDLTQRNGLDLRGRRTLMLGAGGAARGIAPTLLDAGIDALYIVNRTAQNADALADLLGDPKRVHARYLDDLPALGEFDLIVNATSATRGGELPHLPMSMVGRRTAAVDLSYGEAAIPFLAWARANRCHDAIDGLGMLVEQAAGSFEVWHGVRPDTDLVYADLRAHTDSLVTAD
ncbi:shikimate dehydrogenase [Thermomonas carbonis]|uniref:Shikimate dehydrogenase (NADP(+)) n=1 Tax=Thermomonas carbonis TaxID=1463158 RepID=A0A7G9SSM6_9GAMM|nr:shikimate dehydrogenase [Thermomonas carbonis]QNN70851.1 shikimate dehydrogenase [Thermomonas carbonis]GHC02856.1 shikimate dehydrogenase (NADP(+)) [Thermomonas carbonis]